jgi:hypothetical protein
VQHQGRLVFYWLRVSSINPCVLCMIHGLIYGFLKNMYAFLYFTCLKLTCGIIAHFWLQGDAFVFWLGLDRSSLSWVCDKFGFSGRFCSGDSNVERGMVNSSRIEIDKFNGKNFELWKLNMKDLLVEK